MALATILIPYVLDTSKTKSDRSWHSFHEIVSLMLSYTLLSLNYVNEEQNFTVGYVIVAIIISYIAFCILLELCRTFVGLKLKLKRFCIMRQYKKTRLELQSNLKANHATKFLKMKQMRKDFSSDES